MTQEEKNLVVKDLCARLPYGLILQIGYGIAKGIVKYKDEIMGPTLLLDIMTSEYSHVKPYLRPMSNMTEEEKNELRNLLWFGYPSDDYDNNSHRGIEVKQCLYDDERYSTYDFDDFRVLQTFLLKNHFDYCGLIEKGLALEAPKNMYK